MLLVRKLKLLASPEQKTTLARTMRAMNAASTNAARLAFEAQTFRQFDIQKLTYHRIRAEHRLLAQMAVRVIANVAACFKRDRCICPTFRPNAAVSFDSRILSLKRGVASIATLDGRIKVGIQGDVQTPLRLDHEADLVEQDEEFYLYVPLDVDGPAISTPTDVLGVDLGIVNIAVDSDGMVHSGAQVNSLRRRHDRLRKRLQQKGTKSAKRLLRKRRRRETRFARHTNHCISKALVARAKDTGRGIALEDLGGIRERTTVRKAQRRAHHSWSFAQLRSFVTYKAQLAGIALVLVDPRNTSRTCPACGHVDKANRKSQSKFKCVRCGFAGHADRIAAGNIRAKTLDALGRADVNRPDASGGVAIELHAVSQAQNLGR